MAQTAAPAPSLFNADTSYRRSILLLRWALLAAFITFARIGVLDVTMRSLIISSALIAAYDIYHTVIEVRGDSMSPRTFTLTRHLDVATITVSLIAIADVRNPIWAVYFLTIVSAAHIIDEREMFEHVGWSIVNYLAVAVFVALRGESVSPAYVTTVVILLAFMGFNASVLAGGEQRLRNFMASVAVTDSLTGLPNRRKFHEAYPMSMDEAIAANAPLALMLIDFDHFKQINDTYGHPAGDDKLREVGQAMQRAVRGGDLVARYGGDEFIVVAPSATRTDALSLAERLRVAARECDASVSIGVAIFPDDARRHDGLIAAADAALYRAKQAGRNCVREAA